MSCFKNNPPPLPLSGVGKRKCDTETTVADNLACNWRQQFSEIRKDRVILSKGIIPFLAFRSIYITTLCPASSNRTSRSRSWGTWSRRVRVPSPRWSPRNRCRPRGQICLPCLVIGGSGGRISGFSPPEVKTGRRVLKVSEGSAALLARKG